MKAGILVKYWEKVRASFWFVPALMALAAVALALGALALDRGAGGDWINQNKLGYGGSAQGASTVLQTIASSMVTIAGVVFSITLVCLSLASSQFGPRLLRNFMRDTTNQVVLGVFIATFLYCILVLREVRRADESLFVPQISVTLGVLLAVASVAVLVYFIHHVATSIQADEMVARVGAELLAGIDRLFPEPIGRGPGAQPVVETATESSGAAGAREVKSAGDGYLQLVDAEVLMAVATQHNLLLRLQPRPGDYVVEGTALALASPAARVDDETAARIGEAFVLGIQRTPVQDLAFGFEQLLQIGVRALSPGINDPFTALACIDRIGSALHRLAARQMPSPHRLDSEGRLRVIARPDSFPMFVDAAIDPMRRNAGGDPMVLIRLLSMIRMVSGATRRAEDRECLRRQAQLVARCAEETVREPEDRRAIQQAFHEAIRT